MGPTSKETTENKIHKMTPIEVLPTETSPVSIPSHISPKPNDNSSTQVLENGRVGIVEGKVAEVSQKTSAVVGIVVKKDIQQPSLLNWKQKLIGLASGKILDFAKGNYNFAAIEKESTKELLELTGNPKLALTLEAVTPKLSDVVLNAISKKLEETHREGLKEAIQKQGQLITDCLKATLLKMMANVAKSTQINQGGQVTFPDMVSYLLGITEGHLKYIHSQIGDIEKIQDKKVRDQKLKELLEPFKNDIMPKLLPNQEKDIVLPEGMIMNTIRNHLYAALGDALPDLIIKNYHAVMDPTMEHRTQDEEALKKLPGGDVLNALADFAARKLPQKVPGLIGANILPIAEEWAPKLFINEKDPAKLQQLSDWLGNGIRQLVTSESPQMTILWKFSESYLSPIIKHIFLKMAEKSKNADPDNMVNAISKHLLLTASTFFEKNSQNINQTMNKLSQPGDSDQKIQLETELIKLFEPLSDEIITLTGLDKPNELPVPTFLRDLISKAAKEQLPHRLVKLYQDMNPAEKLFVKDPNQGKFSNYVELLLHNLMPAVIDQVQSKAPAALAETLSKEGFIDEKAADGFFLKFIGDLINDPSSKDAGGYLKEQAQKIFTNILVKIASINMPKGIHIEGQQVDLLPNLFMQLITLSKKHLEKIDRETLLRINNVKNLPTDQQEREKEELMKHFIPMGDSLLKLAGFSSAQMLPGPSELRPILFDLLRDKIMPTLVFDIFQGLTQVTVDRKIIVQGFLPEELSPLDKSSKVIAEKITVQLQDALSGNSQQIIGFINKNLPATKLSDEQQNQLGQELNKLGKTASPTINEGWVYIQGYIEGLIFNTFGSLALQYERDHAAEGRRPEHLDALKQASLQMISLMADGLDGLDRDLLYQIKDLEKFSDEERALKIKELAPKFKPLVFKILEGAGIKGPENLPVPSFIKNILWENLFTLLPEAIVGYVHDAAAILPKTPTDVDGLKNLDRLDSTIDTTAANLLPIAQSFLKTNRELYVGKIHQTIDAILPGVLESTTINSLVDELVEPHDEGTKKLLSLIPTALKGIITPLILNISSSSEIEGDVLERLIANLSILVSTHFKNQTESFDGQLKEYEGLSEMGKLNLLDQVFGEFVDDTLSTGGVDDLTRLPDNIRNLLLNQTYNLYQMFKSPTEIQQNYRLQLQKLIGIDIEKLKEDLNVYKQAEEHHLENVMGFAAEKINEQIKSYMSLEAGNLSKLINGLLPQKKLSESDEKWLGNAFTAIANSNDEGIKDLWNYTFDVLKSTLMKLFVDVANQFPEATDPEKAKNVLIPLMLKKIMEILGTNLKGMQAKIKQINEESNNKHERALKMRMLFTPLAKEFFKLAGPKALDALPVPDTFKTTLSEELQQKIIPDLLAEMYVDMAKWEMNTQQEQEKLLRLFKNDNPAAAAKVIAQFATDILPVVITNPEKQVSEKILTIFSQFMLKQPGDRAESINKYMNLHPDEMKAIIKENFAQLLVSSFGLTDVASPAMQDFIEAAILKSMANVFSKINERQNPHFLVDIGLKMIEMANEHFAEINRIMVKEDQSLAYEIDPKVMLQEFKGLHPAIARDPNLRSEDQEKLLYDKFLIPFTEAVLKLIGIYDSNDLPLPSTALREKFFELLKKELGPLILESVMSAIDVDKMLLSVLELANEGIENPKAFAKLPPEFENDETQQRLDTACGELFLNTVKLIPHTAARTFLISEKIRSLPAKSLGRVIRAQLLKTNLLQVINKGILSGLPSLNAQIRVDENGELVIPDDLHFEFAETEEARAKEKVALAEEKAVVRKKLVKELTKTLRDQIVFRIKDYFTEHWKKHQEKVDAWVSKNFGKDSLQVKAALDKIFRLIFINMLGTAFQIISYPFIKLMGFIINIHLRRKSHQISDTIHMDIHRNLVFKLVEEALNAFKDEK